MLGLKGNSAAKPPIKLPSGSIAVGYIDVLEGSEVRGWARPAADGVTLVRLVIDGDPQEAQRAVMDRPDLKENGIGDGKSGFALRIPTKYMDGRNHRVNVLNIGLNEPLAKRDLDIFLEARNLQALINSVKSIKATKEATVAAAMSGRPKIAIVATFSRVRRLLSYHRSLFESLRRHGFTVVACRVNEGGWLEGDENSAFADLLIDRDNVGYDFGSWISACLALGDHLADAEEILFVNDSNFGRLASSGRMSDLMERDRGDFIGITDSFEHCYHLQSYFMLFKKSVVRDGALKKFAENFEFQAQKSATIRMGELGLSQFMLHAGYRSSVLAPYELVADHYLSQFSRGRDEVRALYNELGIGNEKFLDDIVNRMEAIAQSVASGTPLNPTHFFWRALVERFGVPFVKRELVLRNPQKIPDTVFLSSVLGRFDICDIAEIDECGRVEALMGPIFRSSLRSEERNTSKPDIL